MSNPLNKNHESDSVEVFNKELERLENFSSDKPSPLKKAMLAVEAETDSSAETDQTTIKEELEKKIASDIESEIQNEIVKDLAPSKTEPETTAVSINSSGREAVAVLEIQSKQQITKEMVAKIRANADSMSDIARQTELLVKHLEKTEAELTRLGECEVNAARLSQTSLDLMKKQKNSDIAIAESKKRTSLLEEKNDMLAADLGAAKIEFAQLEEKNGKLIFEIQERDAVAAHLKCEKQDLVDKLELRIAEYNRVLEDLSKSQDDLAFMTTSKKESEKLAAKSDAISSELRKNNEQTIMELNDLESRYSALQDRHLEQSADLKKKIQESDSARKELEEKLRLSKQRCLNLEKKSTAEDKTSANDFEIDYRSFSAMSSGLKAGHERMAGKKAATRTPMRSAQ